MKKQTDALKLTFLTAGVAVLSIGCAATGYARYDGPDAMGAGAQAEVGDAEARMHAGVDDRGYTGDQGLNADADVAVGAGPGAGVGADARVDAGVRDDRGDYRSDYSTRDYSRRSGYQGDSHAMGAATEGSARSTVSALSVAPDTRADWLNRFPLDWNTRVIQTFTFAVPDPDLRLTAEAGAPPFSADLEPGAVFVEAAGGAGEIRAGRVIQHSPNPIR